MVVGFLTFRVSVSLFFVGSYNAKYSKVLSSQLLLFNAIGLKQLFLARLSSRSSNALLALEALFKFTFFTISRGEVLLRQLALLNKAALTVVSTVSFFSYSALLAKERRASAFSSSFSRFFSINI